MHRYRLLIFLAVPFLAACSLYEKARIVDRTETELAHPFAHSPSVLLHKSYGGLEEGGDVSLLKLGDSDCAALRQNFVQTQPLRPETREYDTFRQLDLAPATVYVRQWTDKAGADTTYLLDNASCVLYRQAHFE